MKHFIIASDRIIDGNGSFDHTQKILGQAKIKDLNIKTLEIVTLAKRWEDKLNPNQFKSGAAVMAAIQKAQKFLSEKKADLVLIKGQDLLKSGYSRVDREKYMRLYKNKYTPLDGYTKLVTEFLRVHNISEKEFINISHALFENYLKTWREIHPNAPLPDERWFKPLNKYFRGVDCANPNIDFEGQIIIANNKSADMLKISKRERLRILGNSYTKLSVDGFESIPKIAPYLHLKKTITKALHEAEIDFNSEFLKGRALFDTYTCYPVVPMGFLLRMGLVKNLQELPEFLKSHPITITGGLNLAKAPWNLTSFNSIIAMREKMISSNKIRFGLVHGNGSLGNQQGITVLGY
jgi:hypothetical protein